MFQVASFAESTDAVVATLDKELEQLERCVSKLCFLNFANSSCPYTNIGTVM